MKKEVREMKKEHSEPREQIFMIMLEALVIPDEEYKRWRQEFMKRAKPWIEGNLKEILKTMPSKK